MRRRLRNFAALAGVLLLASAVPVAINMAEAAGPSTCSGPYTINELMDNGARWQMCWERRQAEGLILHHVTYTPPGGSPVEILGQANVAQIHVPYDNNWNRFHDVTLIGLGGPYMLDLDGNDCAGTVLSDNARPILCQQTQDIGYQYKADDEEAQGTSLNLFTVSELGAYDYIVSWNFDDDGTIRPEIGAAGSLQNIDDQGGNRDAGWPLGGNRTGIAHLHNFYWRLDFDVAGAANDRVEELEAQPVPGTGRNRFRDTRRAFTTEVARRVAPGWFRSWRVRDLQVRNGDQHPVSVELLPNTDHIYRGPAYESFTQNELYVTRRRPCERFASQNPGEACGRTAAQFVNGQSLNGDVVLWYGTSFHHLPRDEDERLMHPHWSGFSIVPRDLTAENPTVP
jgi:primary-amine oxidase